MSKSAKLSFELVVIVFGLSAAVLMLAVSRAQAAAVPRPLDSVPHEQQAMPIPDGVPSSTPAPIATPAPNPVQDDPERDQLRRHRLAPKCLDIRDAESPGEGRGRDAPGSGSGRQRGRRLFSAIYQ